MLGVQSLNLKNSAMLIERRGYLPSKKVESGFRAVLTALLLATPQIIPGQKSVEAAGPELPEGRIVFVSKEKGGKAQDVYVAESNGSSPKKITSLDRAAVRVNWSKEGKVIFESVIGIYSADPTSEKTEEVVISNSEGSKNHDGYFVECQGVDSKSGTIYVSKFKGTTDQGIYLLEDGVLKRLTINNVVSMVETCGLASPDGKRLAFQRYQYGSHNPDIQGLVITNLDSTPKDVTQEKVVVPGGNAFPLEWSQDGKKLLVLTGATQGLGNQDPGGLILLDLESSGQTRISGKTTGGTFSPDYKSVLYATPKQDGSEIFLFQIETRKSTKIGETVFPVIHPSWEKKFEKPKSKLPPRKIVEVFPGLASSVKNGQLEGDLIDKFVNILIDQRGFRVSDIWPSSLGGWSVTENGFYLAKDQACEDTLRSVETNGMFVAEQVREVFKVRPESEQFLVTHSLGSIRVIRGLQELLDKDPDLDFSKITLVVTHGPNYGVDKPGLGYLFSWGSQNLPKDCNLNLLLFETPFPYVANYPALVELMEMWDKPEQREQYLADVITRLRSKGAKVYALGSYNDCVMDGGTCYMSESEIKVRLMMERLIPRSLVSLTQQLPGAINIMRYLGRSNLLDILGHDSYWKTKEGLEIQTAIVGDQIAEGSKS